MAELGRVVPSARRGASVRRIAVSRAVIVNSQGSEHVDWGGDQNLIVRDLVTGSDRPLTATGPTIGFSQFAEFSTISRDGTQVAYAWFNDKGRYDLRIVPLQGTAVPEPRRFFAGGDEIRGIAPRDWSPDGKWIAVSLRRPDGTGQIGVVAVADGSLRVLKSVDWRGPNRISFSPDGRFLAYDLVVGETRAERHVYVMAADGSKETAAVAHPSQNAVMAWTSDGRHVLFASDRTGETALWAQPVVDGKPQGAAALIKRGIGSAWSLGLTNPGALYVYKSQSANYVQVAPIDLNAGRVLSSQAGSFQRFVGSGGNPNWSRDGKHLAYTSCGPAPQPVCTISITSLEARDVRELRPTLAYLGQPRWSADLTSFLTDGTDFKGRRSLYRIDARTGEISADVPRLGAITQWAPDEKKFYYRRSGSVVERDVVTGAEREMFVQKAIGNSVSIKVSPNGRYIASVESAGAINTLWLISTTGGVAPKELMRTAGAEKLDGCRLEWTPDSQAVIVPKPNEAGVELWLVPVGDGQQPRKLDVDNSDWVLPGGGFAIHPDGRQIAFTAAAGKQGPEVWVLENVLSPLSVKR